MEKAFWGHACETYMGPEDETELSVYRVGVRGPGVRKSRSRDPEAGKGKEEEPRVAESG